MVTGTALCPPVPKGKKGESWVCSVPEQRESPRPSLAGTESKGLDGFAKSPLEERPSRGRDSLQRDSLQQAKRREKEKDQKETAKHFSPYPLHSKKGTRSLLTGTALCPKPVRGLLGQRSPFPGEVGELGLRSRPLLPKRFSPSLFALFQQAPRRPLEERPLSQRLRGPYSVRREPVFPLVKPKAKGVRGAREQQQEKGERCPSKQRRVEQPSNGTAGEKKKSDERFSPTILLKGVSLGLLCGLSDPSSLARNIFFSTFMMQMMEI